MDRIRSGLNPSSAIAWASARDATPNRSQLNRSSSTMHQILAVGGSHSYHQVPRSCSAGQRNAGQLTLAGRGELLAQRGQLARVEPVELGQAAQRSAEAVQLITHRRGGVLEGGVAGLAAVLLHPRAQPLQLLTGLVDARLCRAEVALADVVL